MKVSNCYRSSSCKTFILKAINDIRADIIMTVALLNLLIMQSSVYNIITHILTLFTLIFN
jgi:hypothetical protein